MKLRRDNHFLPVCYQKGFADSSGQVWAGCRRASLLTLCEVRKDRFLPGAPKKSRFAGLSG